KVGPFRRQQRPIVHHRSHLNKSSRQAGKPKRPFSILSLPLLTLALSDFLMSSALCFGCWLFEPVITSPAINSSTISACESGRSWSRSKITVAGYGSRPAYRWGRLDLAVLGAALP